MFVFKRPFLFLNAFVTLCVTSLWVRAAPKSWSKYTTNRSDIIGKSGLKSSNKPDLIIRGKSKTQEQTFYNDAARVWNAAPSNVKDCKTIVTIKKHIKTFVQTLPV